MLRKCGRDTTIDKERCFTKSLNTDELRWTVWYYNSGKNDGKNWAVIMFYIWFKQICFVDPVPDRYNKADYVSTNKW